ncbi:MAG: SelB C-terminal domain-containing protein [Deltaproteobacteria bacterium]|nr:SelB C-terminal domain-containing protein [Deltaproteobacteria bacterium]
MASLAAARHDQRIALDVKTASHAGVGISDLVRRLGVPASVLAEPIATLVAGGELLSTGAGDHAHYLHATAVAELEARIIAAISASPDGLAREVLRGQLPAAVSPRAYDAILAGLEAKGALATAGDRVTRSAAPAKGPVLNATELALLAKLESWGLEPVRPKEMHAALGQSEAATKTALDRLVTAKLVVRVKPDYLVHAGVVARLKEKLLAFLSEHPTIDAQQWKELTGASRKFTIPLAEYFDAEKVTLRVGDLRRRR